jgi:hypothetical protein
MEKLEQLCIVGGKEKWWICTVNDMVASRKKKKNPKMGLPYDLAIPLWNLTKELKAGSQKRYFLAYIHCSTYHKTNGLCPPSMCEALGSILSVPSLY